jgi:5'(3')-deoxyribonucleotidase
MDEVIADTVAEHLSRYNKEHGEQITKADLQGKWLWQIVASDRIGKIEEYLQAEDFFESLEVMPDAQRVLMRLQDDYEIFIASAAMEVPTSFAQKFRWMQKHFPFIAPSHMVFCGDKTILNADYLIDDNARQFKRFPGEGILFSAPHNVSVTGYRRVHNWVEVEELFLSKEMLAKG